MRNPLRKLGIFWGEMVGELKQASWPNQKEMRHYVAVVLVGMALLGIYVSIVDFSLLHVFDLCSGWVRGRLGD
ncbi:MAG: preprotein translocase subunit SecE [Puniceicoccales bacterium]|jgi:preprotein translocase SecE subunit|nr:preprotein translocase subunit SecE [Puniceicoccales bacterium]